MKGKWLSRDELRAFDVAVERAHAFQICRRPTRTVGRALSAILIATAALALIRAATLLAAALAATVLTAAVLSTALLTAALLLLAAARRPIAIVALALIALLSAGRLLTLILVLLLVGHGVSFMGAPALSAQRARRRGRGEITHSTLTKPMSYCFVSVPLRDSC